MKIQSSSISMASAHEFHSYSHVESLSITGKADAMEGVILNLSKEAESKDALEAMKDYQKEQKKEAERRQAERLKSSALVQKSNFGKLEISDEYKLKLELLKQMFDMLSKGGSLDKHRLTVPKLGQGLDFRSRVQEMNQRKEVSLPENFVSADAIPLAMGSMGNSTVWTKVTATSGTFSEYESTTFASQGKVQTEDGRSIDFNVSFSMSRAFTAEINTLEASNYIVTDPLVINMDTDMTKISDQKFFFDLDVDGKEEEISFVGKGSGFLALDKNGDGTINDGGELFGVKSGDGFKDLAAYDKDGNLWIDENDDIFKYLKVWTKDEEGNDILMDLKSADVGAIYLGNADTEFAYKDEAHKTNAFLRKTGVYLKESTGQVGTVSHVDMVL